MSLEWLFLMFKDIFYYTQNEGSESFLYAKSIFLNFSLKEFIEFF